jgi:alcohol dehydrogenase class IV
MTSATDFTWQDGERTVRFGRGAIADAGALLGDGYVLLTTERAAAAAPGVVDAASTVRHVAPGLVDELAARLLADGLPDAELLVGLGGGRVVDVAKAVGAARGGPRVAAIPTTLSAAEMTRIHRHAAGVAASTPRVRPAVVLNDPALSASQPEPELAASAANSLGHAVEGPLTDRASPVPALAGGEAVRLTEAAYVGPEPDRDALALAALLSGYAIDACGYGLHHVLSQTLVRCAGVGHGPANAAMLPHSIGALRERVGDRLPEGARGLARDLAARAGAERLGALGVERDALPRCAATAASRAELQRTPPAAGEDEILALYEAAW